MIDRAGVGELRGAEQQEVGWPLPAAVVAAQARPVEPAEAVDGVRDVVRRLREAYR